MNTVCYKTLYHDDKYDPDKVVTVIMEKMMISVILVMIVTVTL